MERRWRWVGLVLTVVGLVGCGVPLEEDARGSDGREAVAQPEQWHGEPGEARWVRAARGVDDDRAVGIEHDRDGNVITLGSYFAPVDFGAGPIGPSSGLVTALAKYRPDGSLQWVKLFTTPTGVVFASALALDKSGNILFAGGHSGGLDLGSGPLPSGSFLARLDRQGTLIWVKALAGDIGVRGITADSARNVAISGVVPVPVDFGGGVTPVPGPSTQFLATYSPSGAFRWVFIDPVQGFANGVAVDSRDDFYISSRANTEDSSSIPRVLKVSSSGTLVWERRLTGARGIGLGIAVCGDRVVATGAFTGSFTFAGRTISASRNQGYVVAYSRAGREHWAGALGDQEAYVDIDSENGVFVTGRYFGGMDFGLGLGPLPDTTAEVNAYVARFDRMTGHLSWVRTVAKGPATPADISVTKHGEAAIIGLIGARVDFGIEALDTVGKGDDVFVLQLNR